MNKLAYLFPGQGSQKVGMGADLTEAFPEAAAVFAQADDVLGIPLGRLCLEGPADELTETRNAQPAILLHSLAVHAILSERTPAQPALTAGHSLGEFSAAAAAGALGFEDALRLVRARGELMWKAGVAVPGAMSAVIGLEADKTRQVCAAVSGGDGVVVLANHNSPAQMVISGDTAAVEAAAAPLKEAGARIVKPLPVSGAFHSPLMEAVQSEFAQALGGMSVTDPSIPVLSNVTARPMEAAAQLESDFVTQLVSSVLWHDSVAAMVEAGVTHFIEVGPGNVLTNLGKRTFSNAEFLSTSDVPGVEKVLATLRAGL